MANLLPYTMFQRVLFPPKAVEAGRAGAPVKLRLQKQLRYDPDATTAIHDAPLVVFDFETTGLDAGTDRMIELGAVKIRDFEIVDEFHTLIQPDIALTHAASKVTGITDTMLAGAPAEADVVPKFLEFMRGSILVAHNAEFDLAFLKAACLRLSYQLSWPCFCTLKMARTLLPELESKGLDMLAKHFGLEFEARHRSIGDVKVTCAIMAKLWEHQASDFIEWQHLKPFQVE